MIHEAIIMTTLLGAVGPGPNDDQSESIIVIDADDDWGTVSSLIETLIAPTPDATGLILVRQDQPAGEVLVTNDRFEGPPDQARWIVPIMLDSAIEQMPAWWTMRTGRAQVQDDPPASPDQAVPPTGGLGDNSTLRRLAAEAGMATRSLIASKARNATNNPVIRDRNRRDDSTSSDPFTLPVVSMPMVDPFDPQAPTTLACWFLDADARQAALRIEGDIKAADRIVTDMQDHARRMRLPSIVGLVSVRIPRGAVGFASLCLHESWPLEAWSIRAAIDSFRQDLKVRRDRLRGLASKYSRIYELSPEQAEAFSWLLTESLNRVLPIGLQIDRDEWIRFENHINDFFEQWKTNIGSVSATTDLYARSGLLTIAWRGQVILGGEKSLTSSERLARDAQHAWLADRALASLVDGSNPVLAGVANEIRSAVLERISLSMSPTLFFPLDGDGELLTSRLEAEFSSWGPMSTSNEIRSDLIAQRISEVIGEATLRKFPTGDLPLMRSRSLWSGLNITFFGSRPRKIELPDGRIIGVPHTNILLNP